MAGGNREALAIAKVCSLNFIRVEGFVFSHIADEGFMDANAGTLLRYRRNIQADNILVFTDIKKKHRWAVGVILKLPLAGRVGRYCILQLIAVKRI